MGEYVTLGKFMLTLLLTGRGLELSKLSRYFWAIWSLCEKNELTSQLCYIEINIMVNTAHHVGVGTLFGNWYTWEMNRDEES